MWPLLWKPSLLRNWLWRPGSGSTVYSVFTVLPLYFGYIFLQGIWGKVLSSFIHCKHAKNTIFLCVRISIAHLVFIAVDVQFTVFYCTSSELHLFAVYYWKKVVLLLRGFCCHNTLFQLFSPLLTIFSFQFPIKFIDVFCYLQIWEVWLQRLEEMKSSQRGHISMHNVKVCFPNCLLPPY